MIYRLYRVSSGLRYWCQRRFTRPGLALLAGLVLACMMGPDTDNNVAYQGIAFLLALLLAGFLFSFFFPGRFAVKRVLPRFGTAGHPLNYSVLVKNLNPRAQAGLAIVEDLVDPRPGFQEWLAVQLADEKQLRSFRFRSPRRFNPFQPARFDYAAVPPLASGQEVAVACSLTPLRRGVLQLAGLTLARPDPLGLFRALRRHRSPQNLLVLPKRYPLPPIALPGAMRYQRGGVALASNVGQSDEFVALREYRQGDPLRHIHWRSWARVGKPVVREYEDEFFVRHALVLDTFVDHPHSDVFEEAVSVAASFACTLQTQESLLDLLFVGTESYCFTSGRGLAHADQLLEILASVRVCSEQTFAELEHLVLKHASLVSGCICVLLAWDTPRQEFVRKLRALDVPVLVLVVVNTGQAGSLQPGPLIDEPDRFRVLELGKIQEGLALLT
jgi:uncharacterized protein (DUF58 family)